MTKYPKLLCPNYGGWVGGLFNQDNVLKICSFFEDFPQVMNYNSFLFIEVCLHLRQLSVCCKKLQKVKAHIPQLTYQKNGHNNFSSKSRVNFSNPTNPVSISAYIVRSRCIRTDCFNNCDWSISTNSKLLLIDLESLSQNTPNQSTQTRRTCR